MAKDPAFLFYPGDYLRDTQCLSEPVQVAYDRIMCEHMRNICITQAQLNFFTKKLNQEQKDELMMVLEKVEGGYQIEWVVASITKRRAYSKSRSENRTKKPKNISSSYDNHMENAIENVNEDENKIENEKFLVPQILQNWYKTFPTYTKSKTDDFPAILRIISFMMQQHGIPNMNEPDAKEKIQGTFNAITQEIKKDQFWINKPIKSIANNIQEFYNKIKNPQHGSHKQPSSRQAANKQSIDYLLDSISNDIQRTGEQDNRA